MRNTLLRKVTLIAQNYGFCNRFFKKNITLIAIITITLFPTLILICTTFVSLSFFQDSCIKTIEEFADEMYQDQINNSQLQNKALVFQLNQQVQKIAWQMNLLNEFLGRNLLGEVVQNLNYRAAIHNIDRSYYNDEDPIVLALFKQNPILTSAWHHVNKTYISEFDTIQTQQLVNAERMDSIWKAIKYDNKIQDKMWLKMKDIFLEHEYDGLLYMTSINSTFSTYPVSPDCPYQGIYKLDIRCRFYYSPTMENVSTMLFAPQILYTDSNPYLASNFCQRRLRYASADPNSDSEKYSILCISLDLSEVPQYFTNIGDNTKYQMLLDPANLTVVYYSLQNLSTTQVTTLQSLETDYLTDQLSAQDFLSNVSSHSEYILSSSDIVDQFTPFANTSTTFEYNRNGTQCFVILNIVTMLDKIPSYETLKTNNPEKKYQLKNAFLFLNVLSKEGMQQYSKSLENTIVFYNKIFNYVSWCLVFVIVGFQIYYSFRLGVLLLNPVVHLTKILNQIQAQNQKSFDLANQSNQRESLPNKEHQQNQINSLQHYSSSLFSEQSTQQENQLQIDEQLDSNFEGICFSSDTQVLLDSFQNLFKILRFTTQNYFKENESISLLNLNIQIKHFQQFGNYRALGVCHNNMGVIHYNCKRYQESLEHFQKAIIYAKYELGMYSHDQQDSFEFCNSIQRFTIHLRSTLFSNISQNELNGQTTAANDKFINSGVNKIAQNSNCALPYSYNAEKEQLYWILFNRNENYLKTLGKFLDGTELHLWDIFQDYAFENTSVSQLYLQPSIKREMMNYYVILIGYYNQNLFEESNHILDKLSKLYIKSSQAKHFPSQTQLNAYKSNTLSQFMQVPYQSAPSQGSSIFFESQIFQSRNLMNSTTRNRFDSQNSLILLTPIQKNKERRKKTSQIPFNYQLEKSSNHSIISQNINSNQKRSIPEKSRKFRDSQTRTLSAIVKVQNSQQPDQEQNLIVNTNKANFNQIQNDSNKKEQQNQYNIKIVNAIDNSLEQTLKGLRNSSMKIFQQFKSDQNRKQSQKSSPNSQIIENILRQSKKIANSSKNKKESRKEIAKSQRRVPSFYTVRKSKKSEKLAQYEFSSDIYFCYYALQQSLFQMKQKNYYLAASLLTNVLEECEYYLPHLKRDILNQLSQIFKVCNFFSQELSFMKKQYDSLTYCNFHISVINSCHSRLSKKRVYQLSSDLINDILYKKKDSFGLIQYSFDENIYIELINQIQIDTINSNSPLFVNILQKIYQKESQSTQQTFSKSFQYEEVSNLVSQRVSEETKQLFLKRNTSQKSQNDRRTYYSQFTKEKEIKSMTSSMLSKEQLNVKDVDQNNSNSNVYFSFKNLSQNNLDEKNEDKSIQKDNYYQESYIQFPKTLKQQSSDTQFSKNQFLEVPSFQQEISGKASLNQPQENTSFMSLNSSSSSVESIFKSNQTPNLNPSFQDEILGNLSSNQRNKQLSIKQNDKNSAENQISTFSIDQHHLKKQNSLATPNEKIKNYQFPVKMIPFRGQNERNNEMFFKESNNDQEIEVQENDLQNQPSLSVSSRKYSWNLNENSNFNSSSNIINKQQVMNNWGYDSPALSSQNANRRSPYKENRLSNLSNEHSLNLEDQTQPPYTINLAKKIKDQQIFTIQSDTSYTGSSSKIKASQPVGDNSIANLDNSLQINQNLTLNLSINKLNNSSNLNIKNLIESQSQSNNLHKKGQQLHSPSKRDNKNVFNQNLSNFHSFSFQIKDKDALSQDIHNEDNRNNENNNSVNKHLNIQEHSSKILSQDLQKIIVSASDSNNNNIQIDIENGQKDSSENQDKLQIQLEQQQEQQPNVDISFQNQTCKQQIKSIEKDSPKVQIEEQKQFNDFIASYHNIVETQQKKQNVQSNLQRNDIMLNQVIPEQQQELDINQRMVKKSTNLKKFSQITTGEEAFHLGIHTALKKLILNSDEKITTYLSKRKNQVEIKSCFSKQNNNGWKQNHSYMIYTTDQSLIFKNKNLLNELCILLINLDVELLVLFLNQKQSLEEYPSLENIFFEQKAAISFFNTESKLLQYIYNGREHLKNHYVPMMIEHF